MVSYDRCTPVRQPLQALALGIHVFGGGGYILFCEGVAEAAGPLHQVMTPRDFLLYAIYR